MHDGALVDIQSHQQTKQQNRSIDTNLHSPTKKDASLVILWTYKGNTKHKDCRCLHFIIPQHTKSLSQKKTHKVREVILILWLCYYTTQRLLWDLSVCLKKNTHKNVSLEFVRNYCIVHISHKRSITSYRNAATQNFATHQPSMPQHSQVSPTS